MPQICSESLTDYRIEIVGDEGDLPKAHQVVSLALRPASSVSAC